MLLWTCQQVGPAPAPRTLASPEASVSDASVRAASGAQRELRARLPSGRTQSYGGGGESGGGHAAAAA